MSQKRPQILKLFSMGRGASESRLTGGLQSYDPDAGVRDVYPDRLKIALMFGKERQECRNVCSCTGSVRSGRFDIGRYTAVSSNLFCSSVISTCSWVRQGGLESKLLTISQAESLLFLKRSTRQPAAIIRFQAVFFSSFSRDSPT
jgi:hypothetical protein